MTAAIETDRLTKRYGRTVALDSLNLAVPEGEVYGYLGPNGAGKTTTIRLLLGLHRPSAGRAALFGVDAWADPVRAHRRVAYVAGEPFLWPSLTGTQTLEFLSRVRGEVDVRYRDELVRRFSLDTTKKVRALSKGNRQKVQLIAALATRADVLLLDEPTAGLDPLRMALGLGIGAAAIFWLMRVLSDILRPLAWVRWATPLGWAEELRPFAGPRPAVLLLPLGATAALLLTAARISMTRDVGSGLISRRNVARSSGRLLSSPAVLTVRRQRGVLVTWVVGVAAFAAVLGAISTSISGAGFSKNLEKDFAKLGAGSIVTPTGYLSFVFIIFIFATCLFVVSQMGAARQEEADQQLETLLALPLHRSRWFVGRLVIAAAAAVVLSGTAGLVTWASAASQGLHVSLGKLMEAGANGVPLSLMVLGISALAYAVVPRASTAVSYGLVTGAFLWYLVGSVFGMPRWVVGLTPFQHIGLVPAQSFRVEAAVVMVIVGVVAAVSALAAFRQRDLLGE